MAVIRIGLAGVGKIAREQHIPVLLASPDFELVACAGQPAPDLGIPNFPDLDAMLAARGDLDAIAIATPTQMHYGCARAALAAGKHVIMEKPPCTTLSEWHHLVAMADRAGLSLFQSWHLRGAPLVARVRDWLAGRRVTGGRVIWKENVADTHPRQDWVLQAGGFGVLDAGINALSILTAVMPESFFVDQADLSFLPGQSSPIAAEVQFRCENGARISAEMDFAHAGPPAWDVELKTDGGHILLSKAATIFSVDGKVIGKTFAPDNIHVEYTALYCAFASLIRAGQSDTDVTPLRLIADIFLVARHKKDTRILRKICA